MRHTSTLFGVGLLAAVLITLSNADQVAAQGIYVGPGGISLGTGAGSYYIPFDNGYNRRGYYGPNGTYGPRDYFSPGYNRRGYGRAAIYWSPGMYWSPNNYWYGDRNWSSFDVNNWRRNPDYPYSYATGNAADANLPVPQLEELQRMNWTHLRRVLAYGAAQLDAGLSRLNTGANWAKYLRVERLQVIAEDQSNVPPTRDEVSELTALLNRYSETAENEAYTAISGQWGFETVQLALAEFLENPAVRYRQQLVLNANDMDAALERFQTGAGWQQFLSLPADLFVDPKDAESVKSPPDQDKLRKALVRFDDVAKNPAYRVIAEMPAFQATHASLARYLGRHVPEDGLSGGYSSAPPADPSAHEPAPEDVTSQPDQSETELPADGAKPADADQPPSKTDAKPAEELVAPPSDARPKGTPAVREKE